MSQARLAETSLGTLLSESAARLVRAGVPQARRDARLLIAEALGLRVETLLGYPERMVEPAQWRRAEALIARRAAREPLSRIIGRREFWGLSFALTPATLDPRPESETLVEALLESLDERGRPLRILDLGTGSGCLLLALLSALPRAEGLGVDLAPAALATATGNAAALGLAGRARFAASDWGAALAGGWDLVVCNPPYVAAGEIADLAPEVAEHDPRLALAGGPDGLQAYRALIPDLARLLAPGGLAALELGAGQAGSVTALLVEAGLSRHSLHRDLAGHERCILAVRAASRSDPD